MLPIWIVAVPILCALISLVPIRPRLTERIHLIWSTVTTVAALWLVCSVAAAGPLSGVRHFFYVDALGAIVMAIIAIVGWTASLYSVGYIRHEVHVGALDNRQVRHYYFWYHLFIATMLFVCVVDNMGLLWVGIEATTIVSAFLVALYRRGEALEAAWKYLMLCGAGIAIALLGVILLYTSAVQTLGSSFTVLNWSVLKEADVALQPAVVSLAFVFLLVGLGTKVGFAPLHFWLPDAHSQAPTPVSAVLSGVLLNCAMLVLIRFAIVAGHSMDAELIRRLFLGAGLLSIVVAFPFIIVQRDLKRMLAFSTVEHMGIIAVAIGIGGTLGYTAALLQMVNHAMTKSLLFLTAGNLAQAYGSKNIDRIKGVVRAMPFTGVLMLIGALAIVGTPPFGIFTSEFAIVAAGFNSGHPVVVSLMIIGLACIFGAMMYHYGRMAFGEPQAKLAARTEDGWTTYPLLIPFTFVVLLGLYVPPAWARLLAQAAEIMMGGSTS
jgi:hydrogenase-4 component F